MDRIGIDQAAAEISEHCIDKRAHETPYFFIVGAGLSASVVPQASKVIEMLRKRAADSKRQIPAPPSDDPMTEYGHWFQSVLNSRGQQRAFLEGLMRNAEISAENLRLALLLLNGKIGNIVVTPNFDDFLSRALTLFGHRHIVSDNAFTSVRIRPESPEIQIVHVHGTYWFYDCANLEQDIVERARAGDAGGTTTFDLLTFLLRTRSPIVIGYSGWDKDVIMRALSKRLQQHQQFPLEYPLYWCCYNQDDLSRLPACIKDHPNSDVRVVVPEALLSTSVKDPQEQSITRSAEVLSVMSGPVNPFSGGRDILNAKMSGTGMDARLEGEPMQRTLPARDVLSRLMLRVQVAAPPLLADPAGFLASHLRQSFPLSSSPNDVIWRLTLQRLERPRSAGAVGFNEDLADLILGTLVSDFTGTIKRGSEVAWRTASQEQMESFADLMHECASGLYQHQRAAGEHAELAISRDEVASEGYSLAVEAYAALEEMTSLNESQVSRYLKSLLRHARVCDRLERSEAAVTSSRKLIDRFYDHATGDTLLSVCLSLIYVAASLFSRQSWDETLDVLNKLEARRIDTDDLDLMALFARGSGMRGMLHLQRGNATESRTCFDEVIQVYGNNPAPQIQVIMAQLMTGRAHALAQSGQPDEALVVFQDVIRRFSKSQDAETVNSLALAYAGAVNVLATRDETAAVALAEEAGRLIPNDPHGRPGSRLLLVQINIAAAFVQQGKPDQALAAVEKVLLAGPPEEPELRMQYDMMRLVKAVALIRKGNIDEGAALLDEVIEGKDLESTPFDDLVKSVGMVEKANFLGTQNNPAALPLLQEVSVRYRTSSFGHVRQLAARARWQRARMLSADPQTADEAISELKAIQSDEAVLSNEQARGIASAAAVDLGVHAEREGKVQEALEIFEQLAARAANWTDLDTRLNVTLAHWNSARLLALQNDLQSARPHYEEVIRRAETLRIPMVNIYHALSLRSLGILSGYEGDWDKTADFFARAEALANDLQVTEREDTLVSIRIARGIAFNAGKRSTEAIEAFAAALEEGQSLGGPRIQDEVETAFLTLTSILVAEKDYAKTLDWSARGIEWLASVNRTGIAAHARLLVGRAYALQQMDKDDDALSVAAELMQTFHGVADSGARAVADSVFDVLLEKIIAGNNVKHAGTLTNLILTDLETGIAPEREMLAARVCHLDLAVYLELGQRDLAAARLDWMKSRLGTSQKAEVQELIRSAEETMKENEGGAAKSESQSA